MNTPDFHEPTTSTQLCKQLVETAEACEVGSKDNTSGSLTSQSLGGPLYLKVTVIFYLSTGNERKVSQKASIFGTCCTYKSF
jgi:hypothetical protein